MRGESLELLDGNQSIAQITPTLSKAKPSTSLADFFLNSPLRDSGIVIERDRSGERDVISF